MSTPTQRACVSAYGLNLREAGRQPLRHPSASPGGSCRSGINRRRGLTETWLTDPAGCLFRPGLRSCGHGRKRVPDQILCSTARRARETWQLAQPGLAATPPVSFDHRVYEASAAQLLGLVHRASPAGKTLLIVGHDPAVPELALMLARTAPPADNDTESDVVPRVTFDRMKAKFPTAAIAVLELTSSWGQLGPGTARLTGFVTPRDVSTAEPGSQ